MITKDEIKWMFWQHCHGYIDAKRQRFYKLESILAEDLSHRLVLGIYPINKDSTKLSGPAILTKTYSASIDVLTALNSFVEETTTL